MSILLDALKRSESQRELGSVPTLQTSIDLLDRDGTRTVSWPAASMMLLAAVLITWLGLQQFRASDSASGTSLTEQPADSSVPVEPESSGQLVDGRARASERSILPKLAGAEVPNSDSGNAEQARPEELPKPDQGLRDYVAPEQDTAESADAVRLEYADRQTDLPRVEVAAREPDTPGASTIAEEAYEPEIISYWQVPEAMREGLPDLRISVLVFAEQPENRFVLLNGERLREGEEMPNGLLLEEVRRDRAIFIYRDYRFYLKS